MRKKKSRYNINGMILYGLVFFAIAGTAVCMVANGKEAAVEREKAEAERKEQEAKTAEEEAAEKAAKEAEKKRAEASSIQPGVPIGTQEPNAEEKVVYLTFDDGPSANTEKILDILEQYDAKATFFITGMREEYRPLIKTAYEEGHTIGLHTYSHDYAGVYSSVDAYFEDLDKIGKVAEEQIGYVPCFIRFPGGSSNAVSKKYTQGIMTELVTDVQEKGYQYYDWNLDSGDGAGQSVEELETNSMTDRFHHVMLLLHDSQSKENTVQALPAIIEYYKNLGYEFRAIDRESFAPHHSVNN